MEPKPTTNNLSMIRKATVGKRKITWTDDLGVDYQNAIGIMKTRIKLSPNDPKNGSASSLMEHKLSALGLSSASTLMKRTPVKEFR